MLDSLFMKILDMTAMGSLVIGIVVLARLTLKKQPKIFSYCLWAVVLLRLLCPVSFSMPVSLLPAMPSVENHYVLSDVPLKPENVGAALEDIFQSAASGQLGQTQQTITVQDPDYNYGYPHEITYDWWNIPVLLGQYVWVLGVAVMLLISFVQFLRLRKKLREAARLRDNIYICDRLDTAFVMGLVKPRIYLPASLSEQEQRYILLHEQHHIRRFDHIFKALAFAALCLHWFNPLVWLAFILAGRDMEMSCDEAVIHKSSEDIRADYSATLLRLSTGRTTIAGAPLAFGEGDAGKRIRNLSKRKKPALWVSIIVATCCAAIIALCAVNNQGQAEMIFDKDVAPGKVGQTFTMPEYPGVTFRLEGGGGYSDIVSKVTATENGKTVTIAGGTRNLYLCDLNGDGKRELCFEVSFGSGYMRCFIGVYNYANQTTSLLGKEGDFDYILRMEGAKLTVDCYKRRGGPHPTLIEDFEPISSGKLSLVGQQLLYIPNLTNISNSKNPTASTGTASPIVTAGPAELVFDREATSAEEGLSFTMPEFAGVTFQLSPSEGGQSLRRLTATENGETKELCGFYKLINLYLSDVNGDGIRDFCASVAVGSGIEDLRITVFDLANQKDYTLAARMEYDYWLCASGSTLIVRRCPYSHRSEDALQETVLGTLAIAEEQLVFVPYPNPTGEAELIFDTQTAPGKVGQTFAMPEYPGVTFQLGGGLSSSGIGAVSARENGLTTAVIYGFPIMNLYLSDLNGDGNRELCATMDGAYDGTDAYILVYDFANLISYTINEVNWKIYWLTMEGNSLVAYHNLNPAYLDTHVVPDPVQGKLFLLGQQLTLISEKDTIQGTRLSPWLNETALKTLFASASQHLASYDPDSPAKRSITMSSAINRYLKNYTEVIGDAIEPFISSSNPGYSLSLSKAQHNTPVFQYLMVLSSLQQDFFRWSDTYCHYTYYDSSHPDQLFVCTEYRDLGHRDIESYYTDVVSGKCEAHADTFVIHLDSHYIHYWGSDVNLYDALAA